jgi:hypothetical protein
LVTVEFKWFGLQGTIESLIQNVHTTLIPAIFLKHNPNLNPF